MEFKAIVFEPGKVGEVIMITEEKFSSIVGGRFERTFDKRIDDNTCIIVNEEGGLLNLPRNRGYFGTFILVKEDAMGDEYLSYSDEEILKIKSNLDTKENFVSKSKYLKTFFEEKNLDVTFFTYTRGNNIITISNYDVIEYVLAMDSSFELSEIEGIIRRMDFANGDINHFLKHMGNALADGFDFNQLG